MIKVEKTQYSSWNLYFTTGAGSDDDFPGNKIIISFPGKWITVSLPMIIKPAAIQKPTYVAFYRKEYGVSIWDNHCSIRYGIQKDEWPGDKTYGFFFPWNEKRMVRHSYYGVFGDKMFDLQNTDNWLEQQAIKAEVPRTYFKFNDYDGEEIVVSCFIEEREWRRGTKMFKWLSYFCKPLIRRSLDLDFDREVGPKKGSWKGGLRGHSCDIAEGELPIDAFTRYAANERNNFKNIRELRGVELHAYLEAQRALQKARESSMSKDMSPKVARQ